MRNSHIVDPSRRPLSALATGVYAPQSKEVLDAMSRADVLDRLGHSFDTSVYEFPGDMTYLRYLGGE